ncbi:tetratricopeptide repeat protein 19, mitochondrial [Alosa alosa]|uniref:tetratricopeptide repeat protein 19, mitochondrial n=1 Tax=Alosa sapidissima TaxID=34773 RepID=UPI001C091A65|nr:tetratricopeptide repeat protein 19, mitochondrial [Alosa sapidissima]XP_048108164.1 tetratricopeptide repeat protein 19, mitochondrial [Alosa alosa]
MALPTSCRLLVLHISRYNSYVLETSRICLTSNLLLAKRQLTYGQTARISPSLSWRSAVSRRSFRRCNITSNHVNEKSHNEENSNKRSALWGAVAAFSFFGKADDERDEAQKAEDEIILLLKKAKLSMMRDELEAANVFLHQAIRLAHQTHNTQAIIYTYSLMANLAFVQGQLTNAEKLFKAAMSFMLSGGTPQDHNAVIEMSLKLASIYASQNKNELAEHGFQFCTESLEAKIEKHKDLSLEELSDEERKDTRLLLGLCLDARARYLAVTHRLTEATGDYRRALQICSEEQGETHPQTLVLMSDLATILDLQGKHDEALSHVKKAMQLGKEAGHPDQHVLLGNMAGILMHQGQFEEASRLYHEALALAQAIGDGEAAEQIQQGLKELASRRDAQADGKPGGGTECPTEGQAASD